ncbi:MAG TPA: FAD-binding protein, partial [Gammaproteobacteria bacterium]|nr:FAD-binding protein [Gammaproteobacteria bacterium]
MSSPLYRLTPNAALDRHNTFRVSARARWLAELDSAEALPELLGHDSLQDQPLLVLGAGSNVLFTRDFEGVVLRLATQTLQIVHEDGPGVRVRAEAGVNWDRFVRWTLEQGLNGL